MTKIPRPNLEYRQKIGKKVFNGTVSPDQICLKMVLMYKAEAINSHMNGFLKAAAKSINKSANIFHTNGL
jgi:hypothetical protein